MHYRIRTIAPQPSGASSQEESRIWQLEQNGEHDFVFMQSVIVGGTSPRVLCDAVTTLEMRSSYHSDKLVPQRLFDMLLEMPNLQDLTIDVRGVRRASPRVGQLALPFRLRRLVLYPVFPGCANLIRGSRDTLEFLVLGDLDIGQTYSDLFRDIEFSQFRRLRALRLQGDPDVQLLSACRNVRSLSLAPGRDDITLFVRHPVSRLMLIYSIFHGDVAQILAGALSVLPALAGLRMLEIEIDDGDDFTLSGHPGKKALADVCRARRIQVSVLRTREPAEWET